MDRSPWAETARIAVGRTSDRRIVATVPGGVRRTLADAEFPAWVAAREAERRVRWVWASTAEWYPALLAAGVRIERCHDLRLCHAILKNAVPGSELADHAVWDAPDQEHAPALFDLDTGPRRDELDEVLRELARQDEAANGSADPARMRLLLAAESAGALVAAEARAAGVPWDADVHGRILDSALGPRGAGGMPEKMSALANEVRATLEDPHVSLDSPPQLLKALRAAGMHVESTSKWVLQEIDHPAIAPLLEYKRLARLLSANGWAWLDEWVRDGRFRPVYVPGGVVTGRWAAAGGGALQIPRQLRPALRADPGWRIIDADVSQLEPRVLAAMARDERMADAARGQDLYDGVVADGAVATRSEAKIAVLGAMYGSTTGDSGRLVPRLRRVYPRAMRLVDEAARTGEEGGRVATWLGRTSLPLDKRTRRLLSSATTAADEQRALRRARDYGRFTRNFVVQGTAAEWALAWMADLRIRLAALAPVREGSAPRSGPVFGRRAHIAFFLHDELIVHAPAEQAEAAVDAMRASAEAAGRLLFGSFPIDFPLDLAIGDSAAT